MVPGREPQIRRSALSADFYRRNRPGALGFESVSGFGAGRARCDSETKDLVVEMQKPAEAGFAPSHRSNWVGTFPDYTSITREATAPGKRIPDAEPMSLPTDTVRSPPPKAGGVE